MMGRSAVRTGPQGLAYVRAAEAQAAGDAAAAASVTAAAARRTERRTAAGRPRGLGKAPLTWRSYLLLSLLVVAAALLRLPGLAEHPMWVDEAESAINSLTILQYGVPTDTYLGLPLYENTLVEPWPEHPEYAYHDSSYSRSGYAIYHGWLPLYLIAGGLKMVGIEPDPAPAVADSADAARPIRVRDDPADRARRNWGARLPMAILGILLVPLAWRVARDMGGMTAAWAAALLVAANATLIELSCQARYYMPTIFICMICVWLVYRLWCRRHHVSYRDTLALAVAAAALFHTHLTTCFAVCAVGLVVALCLPRTRRTWARLVPAALLFLALTVPWLLAVGFFQAYEKLPSAWRMMDLPLDLLRYPLSKLPYVIMFGILLVWALVAHHPFGRRPWSDRVPRLIIRAGRRITPAVLILAAAAGVGYLVFATLIPVASFFPRRLTMSLLAPGVLLVALLVGTMADTVGRAVAARVTGRGERAERGANAPRGPVPASVVSSVIALAVLLQLAWLKRLPTDVRFSEGGRAVPDVLAVLKTLPLTHATRLYATPNDHLPLSFYGGIPVQSAAPIRKRFLDAYPHPVVIVQARPERQALAWNVTQEVAASHGERLDQGQAERLTVLLHQHRAAELLRGKVAQVATELVPPPLWAEHWTKVQDWHFSEGRRHAARTLGGGMLMRRPFDVRGPNDWWRVFFLRFVEAEPPNPPPVVWADRVKNATAMLLNYGEVVYYSPGPVGTPPGKTQPPGAATTP